MALTEKQRKFVEAYMGKANGNATEAARIAGYSGSESVLAVTGFENLRKPNIAAAIEERQSNDPLIASREDRQRFWTQVMLDDAQDMKDRLKASEILGKSQADFVERREISGAGGGPLEIKGIDFTPFDEE